MNLENLWAEIEAEQSWRMNEIRFFQNQASGISNGQEQDQFRRAIILVVYAHFEGFCKFAFSLYVNTINAESIRCGEANIAIAAASLSDLFKNLRNPDMKTDFFRNSLPDDTQLHTFFRDKEFVENSYSFLERIVNIPENFVDTESNLKPVVLRKNLFKLGFQHDLFEPIEGSIHQLLNIRNKISHGELKDGISIDKYNELRDAAINVMNVVKSNIMSALQQRNFLKEVTFI